MLLAKPYIFDTHSKIKASLSNLLNLRYFKDYL
ncbi:hypothetical protein MNBD_GAMMA12-240 [hydrothermal vent metagenome]|uniref:Uncharacterized protein n=1 Tax=hydrothermal vent metagenome TaxID=652676 RepID=A0A3B0YQL4_9ZZZZ